MDIVVTLPKRFGFKRWIEEGDSAGAPWSGQEWGWYMGGTPPKKLEPGDRIYVVYAPHLIGYSPLIRVDILSLRSFALVRGGDAVAVTIDKEIKGFQGYRYRWWDREEEYSFPDWMKL